MNDRNKECKARKISYDLKYDKTPTSINRGFDLLIKTGFLSQSRKDLA